MGKSGSCYIFFPEKSFVKHVNNPYEREIFAVEYMRIQLLAPIINTFYYIFEANFLIFG